MAAFDDDDMMMLDGSEFDTPAPATASNAAVGLAVDAAIEKDEREESVGGGDSWSEDDMEDRDEEGNFFHAADEDDDNNDDNIPIGTLAVQIATRLGILSNVLEQSVAWLHEAVDAQADQPIPLASPWLFSAEQPPPATPPKPEMIIDPVTRKKSRNQEKRDQQAPAAAEPLVKPNGALSEYNMEMTATAAGLGNRVVGGHRLRGILMKELNAHRLRQQELTGNIIPQIEALPADSAPPPTLVTAVRSAGQFARCSVAPYFEMVVAAAVAESSTGLVAVKNWMHPPQSVAKPKKTMKPGDVAEGCEVDVISCQGLRWVKIRAGKHALRDLAKMVTAGEKIRNRISEKTGRDVKDVGPTELAAALDPPLQKLVNSAHDSTLNGCPIGKVPELLLIVGTEASVSYSSTDSFAQSNSSVGGSPGSSPVGSFPPGSEGTIEKMKQLFGIKIVPSGPLPELKKGAIYHTKPLAPPIKLHPLFVVFDVTALVAVCCDTCNGGAGHRYSPTHPILDQQSMDEKNGDHAAAPILSALLKFSALFPDLPHQDELQRVATSWKLATSELPTDFTLDAAPHLTDREQDVVAAFSQRDIGVTFAKLEELSPRTAFVSVMRIGNALLRDAAKCDIESLPKLNWVIVEEAWKEFCWILSTVAGPTELLRAQQLSKMMYIVPSTTTATGLQSESESDFILPCWADGAVRARLQETSKVHARHRAVFGISDTLHAVTVTATRQFVHAALEQGVSLCAVFHPSRALTERKKLGLEASKEVRQQALQERKERQRHEREERRRQRSTSPSPAS